MMKKFIKYLEKHGYDTPSEKTIAVSILISLVISLIFIVWALFIFAKILGWVFILPISIPAVSYLYFKWLDFKEKRDVPQK